MGVDSIGDSTSNGVDVYCSSGICRFRVESETATELRVNMKYSLNAPFQKIEGANPIGIFDGSVNIVDAHQLNIKINRHGSGLIQVVDYYRN